MDLYCALRYETFNALVTPQYTGII